MRLCESRRAVRGVVRFRLVCAPAFNFARARHKACSIEGGVSFETAEERLVLLCPGEWKIEDGVATLEIALQPGESAEFVLRYIMKDNEDGLKAPIDGNRLMNETLAFWREWLSSANMKAAGGK